MERNIELQGSGRRGGATRWVRFYGELKEEIRRVHWTTKEELQTHTRVVVGATLLFGILVYVVDLVCQYSVWGLAGLFGGIR
jgi:preprotein translocase SecE subunit